MKNKKSGYALVLVVVVIVIFAFIGAGLLTMSYGARLNSIRMKNETVAQLAAEAGYEKARFDMSKQKNLLYYLKDSDLTGNVSFAGGTANYRVTFDDDCGFVGSRPIYKIISTGVCGRASREIKVMMLQAIGGWDMGMCRVPDGGSSIPNETTNTVAVNFAGGEIIDMPIHINNNLYIDSPDIRDIHISGSPTFLRSVSMSEDRYRTDGTDKYSSVMGFFRGGINFNQPNNQITNKDVVDERVNTFYGYTDSKYRFEPEKTDIPYTTDMPAVQIEFYVDGGVGKVKITDDCTVVGDNGGRYDYKLDTDSSSLLFERYPLYGYHYRKSDSAVIDVNLSDTYVRQTVGGAQSGAGGQIYVNGNVVIGGNDTSYDSAGRQIVKGSVTIVATGNIWIADSIVVDGSHQATGSKVPVSDNPNAIGLIAQGVIKVIDPGLSSSVPSADPSGLIYNPVGVRRSGYTGKGNIFLPNDVEIEAAITVGGGGFGAENVGSRKEYSGTQDNLIVRGVISESVRGVVGLVGSDGFLKQYYFDERMLRGILPGDMWFSDDYDPTPAGWKDYRP